MSTCRSGWRGVYVSPHLLGSVGVKHLVFKEEPQSLPVPLAPLTALQRATNRAFLWHSHLHNTWKKQTLLLNKVTLTTTWKCWNFTSSTIHLSEYVVCVPGSGRRYLSDVSKCWEDESFGKQRTADGWSGLAEGYSYPSEQRHRPLQRQTSHYQNWRGLFEMVAFQATS